MENQDISMSVQKEEKAFQGMLHILSKVFNFKGIEAVLLKGLKSDVFFTKCGWHDFCY